MKYIQIAQLYKMVKIHQLYKYESTILLSMHMFLSLASPESSMQNRFIPKTPQPAFAENLEILPSYYHPQNKIKIIIFPRTIRSLCKVSAQNKADKTSPWLGSSILAQASLPLPWQQMLRGGKSKIASKFGPTIPV